MNSVRVAFITFHCQSRNQGLHRNDSSYAVFFTRRHLCPHIAFCGAVAAGILTGGVILLYGLQ